MLSIGRTNKTHPATLMQTHLNITQFNGDKRSEIEMQKKNWRAEMITMNQKNTHTHTHPSVICT